MSRIQTLALAALLLCGAAVTYALARPPARDTTAAAAGKATHPRPHPAPDPLEIWRGQDPSC